MSKKHPYTYIYKCIFDINKKTAYWKRIKRMCDRSHKRKCITFVYIFKYFLFIIIIINRILLSLIEVRILNMFTVIK